MIVLVWFIEHGICCFIEIGTASTHPASNIRGIEYWKNQVQGF